jgi:hypothetical protein
MICADQGISKLDEQLGDLARKNSVLKFLKHGYVKHPETAAPAGRQVMIP